MGWSSGSEIVERVATAILENVDDPAVRRILYQELVDAAEMQDWDCQDDVVGIDPILDEILGLN